MAYPIQLDGNYRPQFNPLYYNVKDFGDGATGSGTTDDTKALQATWDAAGAAGGVAYHPPGIYQTSAPLVCNYDNMLVRGAGWGTVIKPVSGANFDMISTPIPASAGLSGYVRNYIGIEQLMIDCSRMTGNVAGQGNGIHWYGVRYSFIRDVYIKSCKNWAILLDGDNTGPGNNFGYDNQIFRCVFDLCNAGAYSSNCEANDFIENRFKWAGSATAAPQPAFTPQDTNAMHLRCGSGYMNISGNILGTGGTYTTECLRLSNSGPCRVENNRFDQPKFQAMTINGGNHMVIGNQIGSPSRIGSVFGVQIGSSNNIIMGNKFDNTAGAITYTYAIGEAGGPFTNNIIQGNNLLIGTSGWISQNPASTNRIAHNPGYNPVGSLTPPAIPASTVAQTNTFGVDCMVLVTGGTVSQIAIGGTNTGQTGGWFRVPAAQTITLTYSVVPSSWSWFGD